jgi:formate dehydrogenase
MASHALTANLLRPGGLYECQSPIDLHPILASIPTQQAPRTRVAGAPLMMMQAPATLLPDEILTPGEGQIRALLNIAGAPMDRLPARSRTRSALAQLDLLVHMGRVMDDTAKMADWVLPLVHPWERFDVTLHNTSRLPITGALFTPAIAAAPPEARTTDEILRALFSVSRPGLRGSPWGRHVGMIAQVAARVDAENWEQRVLDWVGDIEWEGLQAPPGRHITGPSDRATWRVTTPDERIDLLPEAIRAAVGRLQPITPDPERPFFLRTAALIDRAPDHHHRDPTEPFAFVHPDAGVRDGQEVTLQTRYGAIQVVARHDPSLRPDTVDLPAARVPEALDLLSPDRIDPITGAAEMDGLHCRLD